MEIKRAAAVVAGLIAVLGAACAAEQKAPAGGIQAAVLVSANAEWAVVRTLFPDARREESPFGEYVVTDIALPDRSARRVVVFHGGWGKVAAAASTQYVIDRWNPPVLVNLGTCGGFEGAAARGDVILASRTVIYDIIERMGNPEEAVADYATTIDLGWLRGPDPAGIKRGVLVSADQDADPGAVAALRLRFGAAAVDWESGAIAYTAARNGKRVLILRGVTDLVGPRGDETYGHIEIFQRNTEAVMKRLIAELGLWLARVPEN